jgi:hypothetical protein
MRTNCRQQAHNILIVNNKCTKKKRAVQAFPQTSLHINNILTHTDIFLNLA